MGKGCSRLCEIGPAAPTDFLTTLVNSVTTRSQLPMAAERELYRGSSHQTRFLVFIQGSVLKMPSHIMRRQVPSV